MILPIESVCADGVQIAVENASAEAARVNVKTRCIRERIHTARDDYPPTLNVDAAFRDVIPSID
jgi:hypothetical protein